MEEEPHGDEAMNTAKEDAEKLLHALIPFAHQRLQKSREFFPYGGSMSLSGGIAFDAASDGTEQPPSQALIDMLHEGYKKKAISGGIKACAIIYDSRVLPPDRTEKQDAIAAAIDHRDGYSVVVFFPYSFDTSGQLRVENPFANTGRKEIFPE